MPPDSADEINKVAAEWAARADRGLTAAEDAALQTWLGADQRRAGAYLRMSAVLLSEEAAMAAAGNGPSRPSAVSGSLLTRRRALAVGSGALAASLVAGLVLIQGRSTRFDTLKGQKRVVTLEDGSVMTLNTATKLEVRYTRHERLVRLIEGEALFDVAKDKSRPFVVRAGEAEVRAVGTSFTVSRLQDLPVQVLVREGVVDVRRQQVAMTTPMRIAANTRAVVAQATAAPVVVARVEPQEVSREMAWQQGRLVFAGESLSAAAAQFARYSDTRIVVTDPDLAGRGVAGVYDASDAVGFAQAIALSLNAHAVIVRDEVRISR